MSQPLRLLIVDDHPVVREGLVGMLGSEADLEVVGSAADGAEAVELTARLEPDVVLWSGFVGDVSFASVTRDAWSKAIDETAARLSSRG